MIKEKTELKNYKYDIRIKSTCQGLIVKGQLKATREILKVINTLDYETVNYFYQNPLNRTTPVDFIQIINFFEAKYEEPVKISKEELIERSKLKNWYQNQSNDQKITLSFLVTLLTTHFKIKHNYKMMNVFTKRRIRQAPPYFVLDNATFRKI